MDKIKFRGVVENFSSALYYYGVKIPDEYLSGILALKEKRLICTLIDGSFYHCAAMPGGDGMYFVLVNKDRRKQLGIELGDEIELILEEDRSEYGMAVPEEFNELIKMEPEGSLFFHKLSIGKQRSLLHIIGKPKTSETRLKKAMVVLDYLKQTRGTLDFKGLNMAFKEANRKGF